MAWYLTKHRDKFVLIYSAFSAKLDRTSIYEYNYIVGNKLCEGILCRNPLKPSGHYVPPALPMKDSTFST
jgi:hypothetical protein